MFDFFLTYFIEKHPDISTINEHVMTLQMCFLKEDGKCEDIMNVEMKKCHGDLLYRFINSIDNDMWNYYICLGNHQ